MNDPCVGLKTHYIFFPYGDTPSRIVPDLANPERLCSWSEIIVPRGYLEDIPRGNFVSSLSIVNKKIPFSGNDAQIKTAIDVMKLRSSSKIFKFHQQWWIYRFLASDKPKIPLIFE